jgi:hypothetical protein
MPFSAFHVRVRQHRAMAVFLELLNINSCIDLRAERRENAGSSHPR